MKILHICSSYFETSLFKKLFSKLKVYGVENVVYVPRWHNDLECTEKNIYVVDKKFSKLSKFLYWGEQKYILKNIEKRIILSDIDVIHVHRILYGGYVALQLKSKYNIPYIVAIRNSDLYGFGRNMTIYKRHCWNIIQNASKVIYISGAYRDMVFEKYSQEKWHTLNSDINEVIPNGIDDFFLTHVAGIDGRTRLEGNQIRLLSVGDVDKNKNVLTTIKSVELLMKHGKHVSFNVAGKIKDEGVYKRIRSKPYINYLGVINKEQIKDELRKADVFVMPSVHETFGLVYAEAMSQGCPVIYTRGQGFDGQFVDGEVGYSVDCFDSQEIADRIVDILQDYQNISNRCIINSKRYSWDRIANIYKDIYCQCLMARPTDASASSTSG